ncbi:MAG: sulfatase [Planctomycetota bacterium]
MMFRPIFLFVFWGIAATLQADSLNVLFIAADDLRCDLGCYGHPIVKTPHLDRLAARGTLFQRAYCAQAVCNPSRSSLLTGRRPNTLQQYNLAKHFREELPDVVTLPQHFMQHGYFTQNIGKIFHNWQTKVKGDPVSWSIPEVMHYARHGDDLAQVEGEVPPNQTAAIRCECRDVADEAYFDGRIAKFAVEALGQCATRSKPFFLAVGFWKPHLPFNAPKRYWDLYGSEEIPRPAFPDWPNGAPRIAWHDSRELLRASKGKVLEDAEAQEIRRGYLSAISYLDAQVGRVLAELDRLKLTDSTVIVFWSDHGFHLGDHTLWAKTSNFELDARVPLLIVPPKPLSDRSPAKTDAIVELLDLYPTLADLCGLPRPDGVEGVSLRPLLDGTVQQIKPAALTQHPRPAYFKEADPMRVMGHSIRTPKFRYTEWSQVTDGELVGAELYDHSVDQAESVNQVDEPRYAAELPRLRRLLRDLVAEGVRKP